MGPTTLITGARGSIGTALQERLPGATPTDLETTAYYYRMDITDLEAVQRRILALRPEVIYHLAGAKHAPEGELDPALVTRVNVIGTLNVLEAAAQVGARVIFSSTCKACDPETVYGASKLIAERAVLNEGGTVVRYYNVPEAGGNVFRLWEALPADEPIPVTDCWRFFVSMERAIHLTVFAEQLPPGRYASIVDEPRWMPDVARELYPDRELVFVPRRRGDREREPRFASSEHYAQLYPGNGIARIIGRHDPFEKGTTR